MSIPVALLVAFYAWPTPAPNLALHRPVKASSQAFNTLPEHAVDGKLYGQLGFHSAMEAHPWLLIDLGARYQITKVLAHGRPDCCFDQSIPLALEASDDGITFRTVTKRTTSFSSFDPWVSRPRSLVTRYVRFRTLRASVLVLSEVEVYGKRARSLQAGEP